MGGKRLCAIEWRMTDPAFARTLYELWTDRDDDLPKFSESSQQQLWLNAASCASAGEAISILVAGGIPATRFTATLREDFEGAFRDF